MTAGHLTTGILDPRVTEGTCRRLRTAHPCSTRQSSQPVGHAGPSPLSEASAH